MHHNIPMGDKATYLRTFIFVRGGGCRPPSSAKKGAVSTGGGGRYSLFRVMLFFFKFFYLFRHKISCTLVSILCLGSTRCLISPSIMDSQK